MRYIYDAWGNFTESVNTSDPGDLAALALNPFRYRGYVYDFETGFYYLQSRYYDPETGRFINADGYVSTGQGFVGNNMFAYCGNDPGDMYDPDGKCSRFLGFLCKIDCRQASCPESKYYVSPKFIDPIGTYGNGKGYVYVVTEEQLPQIMVDIEDNVVVIVDKRTPDDDHHEPNMQIIDSYKITKKKQRDEIVQLMVDYNTANPVDPAWTRTKSSLLKEWRIHNIAYRFRIQPKSTKDCDFDNGDEGKGLWDFIVERWF